MKRLILLLLPLLAYGQTSDRSFNTVRVDTLREKYPIANVRAFGALGNGVTDDSPSIQAAIDSRTNGGIVFIPEGLMRLVLPSQRLTILSFRGGGEKRTKIER